MSTAIASGGCEQNGSSNRIKESFLQRGWKPREVYCLVRQYKYAQRMSGRRLTSEYVTFVLRSFVSAECPERGAKVGIPARIHKQPEV